MSDKIQLVLIDDHPLFREGVAYTLRSEADIEVVGQGENAEEAIRLACNLLPDLILLDLGIPGGGLHAAQTIAAACPATKIVMLTASTEEDDLMAALKAGARGYILKGVGARELVGILRSVSTGAGYVTPSLAATLLTELTGNHPRPSSPANPLGELTEREHEILERVAAGLSNKEIGQQLHLSEKTVKHYMTNILQKLQVRNRVEAALLAQKENRTS
jgi:two-component system, NarL family, nitrate/nitrite response regulator NarL